MSAGTAHRLALLQEGEQKLNPTHLALWREVSALLPRESPLVGAPGGFGLELFLMKRIALGWPMDALRRFVPKIAPRERFDRKAVASGDTRERDVA